MQPKLKLHTQSLQTAVPGSTECNKTLLGASEAYISAQASLRERDYSALGKLLLDRTLEHVAATNALEISEDKVAKLKSANETLRKVMTAFPDHRYAQLLRSF